MFLFSFVSEIWSNWLPPDAIQNLRKGNRENNLLEKEQSIRKQHNKREEKTPRKSDKGKGKGEKPSIRKNKDILPIGAKI